MISAAIDTLDGDSETSEITTDSENENATLKSLTDSQKYSMDVATIEDKLLKLTFIDYFKNPKLTIASKNLLLKYPKNL